MRKRFHARRPIICGVRNCRARERRKSFPTAPKGILRWRNPSSKARQLPWSTCLFRDDDNLRFFIITYKVTDWKKGRGGSHAKLIRTVWCPKECDTAAVMENLMLDNQERIYIASSPKLHLSNHDLEQLPEDLDGSISICLRVNSMNVINIEYAHGSLMNHSQFMDLLIRTSELEKLPSIKP
ncbi:hypothetical protein [Microvirga roseola]|uniref:hypothetical protein n=1 Tax=Microvirga roseola TaxID=2883126 RepID=UPI001E465CB5|nr:hypothetical protein [Microvirga roseola]